MQYQAMVQTTSNDHAGCVLCWRLSKGAPAVVSQHAKVATALMLGFGTVQSICNNRQQCKAAFAKQQQGKQSVASSAD